MGRHRFVTEGRRFDPREVIPDMSSFGRATIAGISGRVRFNRTMTTQKPEPTRGADARSRAVKLLYLVSEDWYFISHRLPMARAARDAGFEVHVATRVVDHAAAIEREGFILHPLTWRRGNLSPLHLLFAAREVRGIYRQVQPTLAHHVALLPALAGSLAALGQPIICLNALAGFGYAFASVTFKARAVRFVLERLLRWLLGRDRAFVLVQNVDDQAVILSLGVRADKIDLIAGSGVDTEMLLPLPEPPPPVAVGFVGRLLTDKGIRDLVAAHALLANRGKRVALLIAGEADPANPASIPDKLLAEWTTHPNITLLGQVEDVRTVWAKVHIAALPSLREGLPLSLLEAAACGRPIVATDVPGCREIARPGINALLVPPQDPVALADAIERLAADAGVRRRFAVAGRTLVESEFSQKRVGREIVDLYKRLLQR